MKEVVGMTLLGSYRRIILIRMYAILLLALNLLAWLLGWHCLKHKSEY